MYLLFYSYSYYSIVPFFPFLICCYSLSLSPFLVFLFQFIICNCSLPFSPPIITFQSFGLLSFFFFFPLFPHILHIFQLLLFSDLLSLILLLLGRITCVCVCVCVCVLFCFVLLAPVQQHRRHLEGLPSQPAWGETLPMDKRQHLGPKYNTRAYITHTKDTHGTYRSSG